MTAGARGLAKGALQAANNNRDATLAADPPDPVIIFVFVCVCLQQ